jgi:6-pyruvoyltetrahydropterin/6-carboxytetrahydropterin synthase
MIIDFAEKIKTQLPNHLSLHHLKLRETESSYAEWFASDQQD